MERNGRSAAPCARAQRIRSRAVMLDLRISTPNARHGSTARRRQEPRSGPARGPMQRLRAKMEYVGVTLQ
eukprot:7271362-Prymnesium_polylepis.1